MNVYSAEFRHFEDLRGENASVGDDRENVGRKAFERLQRRAVTHLFGLKNGDAVRKRELLDR